MTRSLVEELIISSVSLSPVRELIRDLSLVGVRNEEVNDRDGIIIQSATPTCGGILLCKRSGIGSISVCESEGTSSSDIFRIIKKRHLKKNQSYFFLNL
jgi:hypothetical protein